MRIIMTDIPPLQEMHTWPSHLSCTSRWPCVLTLNESSPLEQVSSAPHCPCLGGEREGGGREGGRRAEGGGGEAEGGGREEG